MLNQIFNWGYQGLCILVILLVIKIAIRYLLPKGMNHNRVLIIICSIIFILTYFNPLKPLKPLFYTVVLLISLKIFFNIENQHILKSFLLAIVIFIVMGTIIIINDLLFHNLSFIKENQTLVVLLAFSFIFLAYYFFQLRFTQQLISKIVFKDNISLNKQNSIIVIASSAMLLFFFYEVISSRYLLNINSTLIIFVISVFIFLISVINEVNKYHELLTKYDDLINYSITFEETIEKDRLLRHEYKNQLSVLKDMTRNKKLIDYIDNILNQYDKVDTNEFVGLDYLPKNGIKGLLFYKFVMIKNNDIGLYINISKTITNKMQNLEEATIRATSYLLGICLDNAIEACEQKNSKISVEIYYQESKIYFVISNTIHHEVKMNKIFERGYSTKGKNRGNGLFFARKIVRETNNVDLKVQIINDYFIQKITITKD